MKIEKTMEQGVIVFRLTGAFDYFSAAEFEKDLKRWIETGRRRIILDLKETQLLDSSGIGAIIKVASLAQSSGRDFRIANMPASLLNIYNRSGLKMQNYESVDAAKWAAE